MNLYRNKKTGELAVMPCKESTISNAAGEWALFDDRIIVPAGVPDPRLTPTPAPAPKPVVLPTKK